MAVCVGKYDNCGSRSSFYVIDNERGFKEFYDKDDAEYAYETQDVLSIHNLAPKVLSQVGKIRYSNGKLSSWGYITEIAETIGCGGNECSCGECEDDLSYVYSNRIRKLVDKIADIGFEFMDAHIGNVGYIRRRGKKVLVCIDCGEESVYNESSSDDDYVECCNCEHCVIMRNKNV